MSTPSSRRRLLNFLFLGRWWLLTLALAAGAGGLVAYRIGQAKAQRAAAEVQAAEARRRAEVERVAEAERVQARDAEAKLIEAVRSVEENRRWLVQKYVSPEFVGKDPVPVVLVAVDERQNYDASIAERFGQVLRRAGVPVAWGIFRPEFVASDDFKRLEAGSAVPVRDFHPENYCRRLICLRLRHTAKRLTDPANVISTRVVLTLSLLAPESGRILAKPEIKAVAVGSSEQASLDNALSWLEKELTKQFADPQSSLRFDLKGS